MYNSQYYTCEQIDQRLLQGYLDDYNSQNGTNLTKSEFLNLLYTTIGRNNTIDNLVTQVGYYECDTAAGTAAKAISVANYAIFVGGCIKIKMTNANTAASGVTLKIGNADAKPLYYAGQAVSASNTWKAGETIEVYYDGTNYQANNVAGGGSGDGVYDISAAHSGATYADLAAALGTNGANVPANVRQGGMSVEFVNSTSGKYEQWRYIGTSVADADFVVVADWESLDDELDKVMIVSESMDIYEQDIYDYVIVPVDNKWHAFETNKYGKSYIIPIDTTIQKSVSCKNDRSNNCYISFLKSLANMATAWGNPDFVSGDNACIQVKAGSTYERTIPVDTKYIVTNALSSTLVANNMVDWNFDIIGSFGFLNDKIEDVEEKVDNIYRGNSDSVEIDLTTRQDVGYGIDFQNRWKASQENIIGRSYVIPVDISVYNRVSCFNPNNVNVSLAFLKSLNNMTVDNGQPDFAAGTLKITIPSNSTFESVIPADTKYIVTSSTNSYGVELHASNFILSGGGTKGLLELNDDVNILNSQVPVFGCKDIQYPKYTVVSGFDYTAVDLGEYLIDSKYMRGVAIHLSSKNDYFETEGMHTIDIWSLMNPNQASHFDVTVTGETDSEGNAIGKPFLSFFRKINRSVRIVFSCKGGANEEYPWYKDFNLDTHQAGVATPILYNGAHIDVSAFNALLNAAGYASETKNEGGPRIIGRINGPVKTENVGGTNYDYVYCLVHMNQYAIIMKTKDNFANLEYVSVFPYQISYEGTIMYLDGTFYIYYRTTTGMKLTTTTDFLTYTEPQSCGNLAHRGEITIYNGMVYLTTTWKDNVNSLDAIQRTNFSVYVGTGGDFTIYTKILHISDPAGTVSPVMLPIAGWYTMVFTTSPFHSEWINKYPQKNHMGKDCLAYYAVRYLRKADEIPLTPTY